MRNVSLMGLTFLALLGPARVADASTQSPVRLTCPIGGERFDSVAMRSNAFLGQRPDGKPYGPTPPNPLPECPGNGFVMFDEKFTESEIELLTEVVAGDEYQNMRRYETLHYRAWWLLLHSGRNDRFGEVGMFLTASWESDDLPERKERYQRAFAGLAMALKRDKARASTWLYYNLRAANAMRELGLFDAAAAHLDKLDTPALQPGDAKERREVRAFIDGLRELIGQRNRAPEPLAMIPSEVAASRCVEGRVAPEEKARCSDPTITKAIEQMRKARGTG